MVRALAASRTEAKKAASQQARADDAHLAAALKVMLCPFGERRCSNGPGGLMMTCSRTFKNPENGRERKKKLGLEEVEGVREGSNPAVCPLPLVPLLCFTQLSQGGGNSPGGPQGHAC